MNATNPNPNPNKPWRDDVIEPRIIVCPIDGRGDDGQGSPLRIRFQDPATKRELLVVVLSVELARALISEMKSVLP